MRKLLPIIAIALLALTGCGGKSHTIDLTYSPVMIENQGCVGRVSLVRFLDIRKDVAVASADGESYFPSTDVGMWVTSALQEQLKLAGCSVDFHDREYSFDTPVTVTGTVEEAFAKQTKLTNWQTSFRIKITVRRPNGGPDYIKAFSGQFEKTVLLPSSDNRSRLLKEGLQDMLRQAVPDILQEINRP